MLALVPGPRPVAGALPSPGGLGRGDPGSMAEFRGLLPRHTADYLERLPPKAARHVVVLLGVFKEVQALAGAGRLLHTYLQEVPYAWKHCRITTQEIMKEKREIFQTISALRQKINRAAAQVGLILPQHHQMRMEELSHDHADDRVS